MSGLRVKVVVLIAVLGAAAYGYLGGPSTWREAEPTPEATTRPVEPGLNALLEQARVVDERVPAKGYDRACGTGHTCSFGPAWSDDVDVEGGHNGCDTRNDILASSMTDVEFRPGTRNCVVIAGTLDEPYTGATIRFSKERASEVGIDHVFPLARAWDLGAFRWSAQRRKNFANDPLNLRAVSGRANSSKRDLGPGEWLPLNAAFRCEYMTQYMQVAVAYDLPITRADQESTELAGQGCG